MNFEILRTDDFSRHLKQLSEKYPSLKKDYSELLQSLQENPLQGTALGKNCFKIRMKIISKGSDKSGGARVITYVRIIYRRIILWVFMINLKKTILPIKN